MMNKTDLLFQMMEHPHAYTDQQWQEILMDEECRELYTLMAKTKSAFDSQKEVDDETIDAEWSRLTTNPSRSWLRVAALFVGVLMLSGITFAAIHIVRWISTPEPQIMQVEKSIKAKLQPFARVRIWKIGSLVLRIFYLQGPDPRRFEEKIDDDEWR